MPTETHSIADLARLSGLNVRTIRYYLAQGLLPSSGESGPGAHYGEGHLDRLRLTKRLQAQHLPLSEIRRRLAELTDVDVASLVATSAETVAAPTTSALEYVRSLLGGSDAQPAMSVAAQAAPEPAPPARAPLARPLIARARYAAMGTGSELPPAVSDLEIGNAANTVVESPAAHAAFAASAAQTSPAAPAPAAPAAAAEVPERPGPERSQWDRLELSPNFELHVRRPLSRLEQRRVERLITIARQVLKEDMK
jgi:DNA-binding transcriptional MerR regulator